MSVTRASRITGCACDEPATSSDRQTTTIRHMTRLSGRCLLPLDSGARAIYRRWRLRGATTLTPRPPCRRVRTFTDVILAREVVVCAGILLLGARYDPTDLRSPKGRQDCCAHRVLRKNLNRRIARGCDRQFGAGCRHFRGRGAWVTQVTRIPIAAAPLRRRLRRI